MFFKKKIIVTEEMKQTLQSFDEISWASCCGIPYKKESYYPYIQETSQASVEKILKHTMNYSDTVCLVNLFKEGISRADAFILQTAFSISHSSPQAILYIFILLIAPISSKTFIIR